MPKESENTQTKTQNEKKINQEMIKYAVSSMNINVKINVRK